jgi:hypothetical protein
MWMRLQLEVTASAYSNVFLVTALVTAVGAVTALMLKVKPNGASGSPVPADGPGSPGHGVEQSTLPVEQRPRELVW